MALPSALEAEVAFVAFPFPAQQALPAAAVPAQQPFPLAEAAFAVPQPSCPPSIFDGDMFTKVLEEAS